MITKVMKAYECIRDAITYGELKSGERLIEKDICRKFDLGRTPFREALRQLDSEGYISFTPFRGAIITAMTKDDIQKVYELVGLLEGFATERAAKQLDLGKIRELNAIESELKRATRKREFRKWLEINVNFHGYFLKYCGNDLVGHIITSYRNRIYRYRLLAIANSGPEVFSDYFRSHDLILKAIASGEAKRAGSEMRRHVMKVGKVISGFLERSPGI